MGTLYKIPSSVVPASTSTRMMLSNARQLPSGRPAVFSRRAAAFRRSLAASASARCAARSASFTGPAPRIDLTCFRTCVDDAASSVNVRESPYLHHLYTGLHQSTSMAVEHTETHNANSAPVSSLTRGRDASAREIQLTPHLRDARALGIGRVLQGRIQGYNIDGGSRRNACCQ